MPSPDFLTPVPHEEAAALIAGKPLVSRQVFDGLLPELRGRAFCITGLESPNVLQKVRDEIASLPRGATWDQSKSEIVDALEPFLGDGADRRAELLLRTHGFQAFQASNWRVIQEDEDSTHMQYLATEDDRVRDSHLALNGIILPKNDPFWQAHYPPWEWGCRCRCRPMNPDLVDEAKDDDKTRAPDDKLVMEGPMARKLREGMLVRNGRAYDVTPPREANKEGAFQWHPDNLRLPLEQLKQRYDPEVWRTFEVFAKRTSIEPGLTVWQWLGGKQTTPVVATSKPAPVISPQSEEHRLSKLSTHEEASVFDSDGKVILQKKGKKRQVDFTAGELAGMEGTTVIHNHPSGNSFAIDDIKLAAAKNLKEIVAVGVKSDYTYVMRADKSWPSIAKLTEAFNRIDAELMEKYRPLVLSGEMSEQQAQLEHTHEAWQKIAKELDLTYERKERK